MIPSFAGFMLGCNALLATPVLFTTVSLTGGVADRAILVTPTAVENPSPSIVITNVVVPAPILLQTVGGAVQTNLLPGVYDMKIDGWPRSVRIVVPDTSNVTSAVNLISTNDFSPINIYTGPVTVNSGGPAYNFSSTDFSVDPTGTNVSASPSLARISELGPAAFVNTNIFLGTNAVVQETTSPSSIAVDETGKAVINVRTNSGVTPQQSAVIAGSYTNLGIVAANICYVSQSTGSVTPVPDDPRYPFLTAQSAANACRSNGLVYVVDGSFAESVVITNSQTWYFADNTFLNGFNVTNVPEFSVFGLGTIGRSDSNPCLFFNYSNLLIECKNWIGSILLLSTNIDATATIKARDYYDGLGVFFSEQTDQSLYVTAAYITNLNIVPISFNTAVGGVTQNVGNKHYAFKATKQILFKTASPGYSATNCTFYLSAPRIQFVSRFSPRGNLPLQGAGTSCVIEGADVTYGPLSTVPVILKNNVTTNDLYFINCRLNLGTNFYAGVTGAGMVRAHYQGCAAVVPNPANTANITNVIDNTLVDATWTNAPRF